MLCTCRGKQATAGLAAVHLAMERLSTRKCQSASRAHSTEPGTCSAAAMDPFYSFPAGGSPLASEVQIVCAEAILELPETCLLLLLHAVNGRIVNKTGL